MERSTGTNQRVLVIDDDEGVRNFITRGLSRAGFAAVAADGGNSGISQLETSRFDAVVCDLNMPDRDGLDVLRFSSSLSPRPAFIVLTGFGSIAVAVEAMKHGASDFIEKPVAIETLTSTIVSVLGRTRQIDAYKEPPESSSRERTDSRRLVGSSQWLEPFLVSLTRIAQRDVTVLLDGETGTGKSAVAREIWRRSLRNRKRFVELNCAAIPDSLMESELFGHKKGSFSGAIADYVGHFEQAAGGTLFLDEVGELKPELQAKLLHVLQERVFSPIGATRPIQADVRFVAASNRNLEREVEMGRFRSDLYYRLNVVNLTVPPLRDRPDDIPLLVEYFQQQVGVRSPNEAPPQFSPATIEVIRHCSWRGNVRELENFVERMAATFPPGAMVEPHNLPAKMIEDAETRTARPNTRILPRIEPGLTPVDGASLSAPDPIEVKSLRLDERKPEIGPPAEVDNPFSVVATGDLDDFSLGEAVQLYEKKRIVEALDEAAGNKSQAARILGVRRTTLIEKMKRLGLQGSDESTSEG